MALVTITEGATVSWQGKNWTVRNLPSDKVRLLQTINPELQVYLEREDDTPRERIVKTVSVKDLKVLEG